VQQTPTPFTRDEHRNARARAYVAWQRGNKPKAPLLSQAKAAARADGVANAVSAKAKPTRKRRSVRRTTSATPEQHEAFMRRLYGKKGKP
jgi:hypothetical protein